MAVDHKAPAGKVANLVELPFQVATPGLPWHLLCHRLLWPRRVLLLQAKAELQHYLSSPRLLLLLGL